LRLVRYLVLPLILVAFVAPSRDTPLIFFKLRRTRSHKEHERKAAKPVSRDGPTPQRKEPKHFVFLIFFACFAASREQMSFRYVSR
jgi:hypothetical protein